jgi:hypothetical protein
MYKNKKFQIALLSIFSILLLGGLFTYRGFALDTHHAAGAYGVEMMYPDEWKKSPYQFYVTATTTQPGILLSSPDARINIALAPKYVGDARAEHPESPMIRSEALLVAATPLKDLPGISAVQMVTHYYGAAGVDDYVASDVLMTGEQLQRWGLRSGGMVEINADEHIAIRPNAGQSEVFVAFSSQEPLTLDQAIRWLNTPNAQAAHRILLSARLHP